MVITSKAIEAKILNNWISQSIYLLYLNKNQLIHHQFWTSAFDSAWGEILHSEARAPSHLNINRHDIIRTDILHGTSNIPSDLLLDNSLWKPPNNPLNNLQLSISIHLRALLVSIIVLFLLIINFVSIFRFYSPSLFCTPSLALVQTFRLHRTGNDVTSTRSITSMLAHLIRKL